MSDTATLQDPGPRTQDAHNVTLFQRLHRASRGLATASGEAAVGQTLIEFTASSNIHVARLLIFTDFDQSRPCAVEMREGWTVDDRPAQPYGTRLSLADYPLLEFMNADAIASIKNVATDERLNETTRRMMALSGIGSFVIVPLSARQNWLGALIVGRNTPSSYDEELIYAWWTLCGQAAAAIQNARLLEQTQQRTTQLEWLALIESTLSQATDEEGILTAITLGVDMDQLPSRILLQYLETDENRQPTTLYPVSIWHDGIIVSDHPDLHQRYQVSEIPTSKLWLAAPNATLFVSDLETDLRVDEQIRQQAAQLDFQAFALMPLRSADRWQGLVTFLWSESHTFSPDEHYYLQQLLEPMSAVVASRRAYLAQQEARSESERRAILLQTATEISHAASSILDPDELIQQAVDLIRERFGLYYAGLFLVDQSGELSDEAGKWAVLSAGTGLAGQQMITQGHKLEIGGESMIGWCVANAQARIALDVGKEAVRFVNPFLPETRSEMALPLISRGHVIGAMTIQSTQEAAFSQEDIALLQTMADQLANAIENTRLFEQTQTALGETETLYRSSLAIGAAASAQDVGQATIDYATTHAVDTARILWLEYKGDKPANLRFGPAWRRDRPAVTADVSLSLDDDPLVAYMDANESIVVSDILTDERADQATRQLLVDQFDLRAFVMMPIAQQDHRFGYLFVGRKTPGPFTEQELRQYATLTAQAAIALENKRLYSQEQSRRQRAEAVVRVGRLLASTLDLDTVLPQVMEEAAKMMTVTQCGVIILDEQAGVGRLLIQFPIEAEGAEQVQIPIAGNLSLERVIETREPLNIVDAETDPLTASIRDVIQQRRIKSILITPMLVGGKIIGTIGFDSLDRRRYFTEEEIRASITLADQMAATLENIRLLKQTQAVAREQTILSEMSRDLTTVLDVEAVIDRVHHHTNRLMDATNFYVALYHPQEDAVSFPLYAEGERIRRIYERRQSGKGLTEYVIRTRRPLLLRENVSRWLEQKLEVLPIGRNAESWLGVPMMIGEQVTGVIAVQSYTTPRLYDDHQRDLLNAVANQTAIAIENARLFKQAQTRAQQEQKLREITNHLRTPLEIDGVMRTLARELGQAMGRRAFVRLGGYKTINQESADQDPHRNDGGRL
jgi:GAF domain-containing protein